MKTKIQRIRKRTIGDVEMKPHFAEAKKGELKRIPLDFSGIVERYENSLIRYTQRIVGGRRDEAEDIVQEAFFRLYKKLKAEKDFPENHISAWLFRVAHNLAMDTGRDKQRLDKIKENHLPEEACFNPDLLGDIAYKESVEKVMKEVDKLPEDQKRVLLLKYIQDMKLREIKESTGFSITKITYQISRGLNTLCSKLKEGGVL